MAGQDGYPSEPAMQHPEGSGSSDGYSSEPAMQHPEGSGSSGSGNSPSTMPTGTDASGERSAVLVALDLFCM